MLGLFGLRQCSCKGRVWELDSQATDDFSSLYARGGDLSLKVVGVWRWLLVSGVSDFFGVAGLVWDWCCGVGGWAIKKHPRRGADNPENKAARVGCLRNSGCKECKGGCGNCTGCSSDINQGVGSAIHSSNEVVYIEVGTSSGTGSNRDDSST